MASRSPVTNLIIPVALFGAGAGVIAAWRGGFYASFVLALLMAGWLAALMFWRASSTGATAHDTGAMDDERIEGAMLRAALEQMPVALISIGDDGRVRALNRAARDLFASGELVVDPPPELADGASRMVALGRTYRIDRIEGSRAGKMRTIAVLVDVENEERMAEARATRELLDVLSHEVMNAITPVSSLAESALAALDEEPVPVDDLRGMIGTLGRRTGGLLQFTGAYRELARLPEPALAPVPVEPLFADLARMFAARWGERVALAHSAATGLCVEADRDQISQALWALIQNAAEAALDHADGPCVTLAGHEANGVTIAVADNGPGVPPAMLKRIFRPFVTTKAEGSGIGLSLAQQIVLGHGGALRLMPQDGSGTRFEIQLRAAPNRLA